jgi:hypothetical protein
MSYLTKSIADALCTVITLGFAGQMAASGQPVTFEYKAGTGADVDADATKHGLVQDAFGGFGVRINIRQAAPQEVMPYILGSNLPQNKLETFIDGLIRYINEIKSMFARANTPQDAPQGAYIGVQFFVGQQGNILGEPIIYGPSALSQRCPVYREINGADANTIADAYGRAVANTNKAARAVAQGLGISQGDHPDFNEPYQQGHIFGSSHGMIRAMVNRVALPKDAYDSVFAEIALGSGTTKVSSCIPCAIFMQSFGYPASSMHLGRGDNWWIPDAPDDKTLADWKKTIAAYYANGVEICNPLAYHLGEQRTLNEIVTMLITEKDNNLGDIQPKISDLFLEALTFEDSFIDRILRTMFP